jgi:hypothetical protein
MVSNTGDIPGTSGGGTYQTSLGSTAVDGMPFDDKGSLMASKDGRAFRKRRRGVRSTNFYKEPGRMKKPQRSMKRKAKRGSGRR